MREILENHNLGFEEILNSSVLNQTSNFYSIFDPPQAFVIVELN
ncbi:hypothetical protein LEP1GSC116_2655 [Leptospira interrogans serovar Icterohaemorrhagiae str. Verdun HP]|uniref:Uncharacterized protein n=1 Tax=Leptospira interrogans serovar Icterohaemorrhagiae str. Verdun HP TaxID=1049910 RepID=M6S2Y0_LEPIR|nr:hypothetical protein LEP1GSC116_2655 [Leptospira interrogans serovar Icterohaemorrhagiae str. Verdun HP]